MPRRGFLKRDIACGVAFRSMEGCVKAGRGKGGYRDNGTTKSWKKKKGSFACQRGISKQRTCIVVWVSSMEGKACETWEGVRRVQKNRNHSRMLNFVYKKKLLRRGLVWVSAEHGRGGCVRVGRKNTADRRKGRSPTGNNGDKSDKILTPR